MAQRILTPAEATALQTALNAHGASLVVDAHFGELSRLALIRFQFTKGLPETGNPDEGTLDALGIPNLFTQPKPIRKPGLFDLLALIPLLKGKPMTADQITGVIRAILAAVSGFFIAKGAGDADLWNWIIAGVTGIVPVVWTWLNNRPKVIEPMSAGK